MDPVTLEIAHGKMLAAVDEMATVLARTSMSPVIYEVLDFACGICDPRGDLIAQANGLTLFTGTFAAQVRFVIEKHCDRMQPGDAYITNDPFNGGTHCCDMAVIRPLFDQGRLIGFAIAVAHWLDVGGAVAGSLPADATEIFQEGLRLPGIQLCRDGQLLPDICDIIAANSRLPTMAMGDLNAELAAVNIAAARVDELCGRYGADGVAEAFAHILATAKQEASDAVSALPDGVYEAEDWVDGDGQSETRIPVQVKVTIDGSRLVADFTGSADARPGPINCTRGALQSAVKSVFKALVGPHAPSSEGWFHPVEIIVPDGTIFSAVNPSPIGWYYEGAAQASELVWKALAPVAPERFSAGSYMSLCATYICGEDRSGAPFVHIEPQHGGWGATPERDGASGLIAITDGDTYNLSAELLEAKYPLRLIRYAFNTDNGPGAGRHRGGLGLVREYEVLGDNAFTYASLGRSFERPWGADGGGPGSTNYLEITSGGRTSRVARIPHADLKRGDRVAIVTGGGGGWGDPSERDPDAVAADLADGLITREEATALYRS